MSNENKNTNNENKSSVLGVFLLVIVAILLIATYMDASKDTESKKPIGTVSTNEIGDVIEMASEETDTEIPEDAISGTIAVPMDNDEVEEDTTSTSDVYYVSSYLTGEEVEVKVPEGFEVTYQDDYTFEFAKPFDESVEFSYTDEETGAVYHDEVVCVAFNNVRNTPYCDSTNYIKAQLMNTGYDKVYEANFCGKDIIITYADINREESEDGMECLPKTSLCWMYISDESADCTYGDCDHTEIVEVFAYTYKPLSKDEVMDYVETMMEECSFEIVRG